MKPAPGHVNLVKLLVQHRAKLNARNAAGDTALGLAALQGHLTVVQQLVSAGASQTVPGWPPLVYAAFNGHLKVLEYLLVNGAAINAASDNGMTALMVAARGGHLASVQTILAANADLNALSDRDESALDIALRFKNTDIADLIRSRGGKPGRELRK